MSTDSETHSSAHGQVIAADSAATDTACHASASGGLTADPAAAALLREHVMGALLVAVEDYSTDNRWAEQWVGASRGGDRVAQSGSSGRTCHTWPIKSTNSSTKQAVLERQDIPGPSRAQTHQQHTSCVTIITHIGISLNMS